MKYVSFKVTEVEAINKFLEEQKGKVANDGVAFIDGMVCILYEDRTREQIELDMAIDAAQIFVNTRFSEVLGHDVDVRYWRRQALLAHPKAAKNVVVVEDLKANSLMQLQIAKDILKELQGGEYLKS